MTPGERTIEIERRLRDEELDPLVRRDLEEELTRILSQQWETDRDARADLPTLTGEEPSR